MPYNDFTVKKIQDIFQVIFVEKLNLFFHVNEILISRHLTETLEENVPLAIAVNTEKARSELIISPVLVELRKRFEHRISLFSGVEFNVDKQRDLNGYCDFIISFSSEQLFVKSPVITIVEAKNENLMSGLGQCIAEMIAANIFNEQEGSSISKIYGVVTSGTSWKFMKLQDNTVFIDLNDYSISNPNKIVGILSEMIEQKL